MIPLPPSLWLLSRSLCLQTLAYGAVAGCPVRIPLPLPRPRLPSGCHRELSTWLSPLPSGSCDSHSRSYVVVGTVPRRTIQGALIPTQPAPHCTPIRVAFG